MVRLLRVLHAELPRNAVLSIPQWCDCCEFLQRNGVSISSAFNPTMVRLLQNELRGRSHSDFAFNPTMVRLLPGNECPSAKKTRKPFNPTMVRLLPRERGTRLTSSCPFNPTMVRLLRKRWKVTFAHKEHFQSHNGAIAANSFCVGLQLRFTLSIPQWCDCCS